MIYRKIKSFLYRSFLPYAGLLIVKMIRRTHRVRIVDPENESALLENGGSLIYASWHQRFFPGITFFATRKPIAIMISQSSDGDLAAHGVKILGWLPVRGSSSRGGRAALKELNALAMSGYKIGHIVDGPKGPFGVVKPGLLRIAQATGLPIVPTITSAENNWMLNSWDKFLVPKLFSRVIIRFGKPIAVPEDLTEDEFEKKRLVVEQRMKELYADTDRIWNDSGRIHKIFGARAIGKNFFQLPGR